MQFLSGPFRAADCSAVIVTQGFAEDRSTLGKALLARWANEGKLGANG
jgi:hypothetical protein